MHTYKNLLLTALSVLFFFSLAQGQSQKKPDRVNPLSPIAEVAGLPNVLIIGDIIHSRVALSNIFCLQKLGANVGVCGPSTLMPKFLKSLNVEYFKDLKSALSWSHVANVLRIQLERQKLKYFPSLREYSSRFGVTKKVLDEIKNKVILMHPGPINRGVEISSDVADSKQSIILDQVENGVAIRMAVLYLLAKKIKK